MEDEKIIRILKNTKKIVVVGLSPKEHRASFRVSQYLKSRGYKIIPVYPREDMILGEKVYRSIVEIPDEVELVLIFRRSEEVLDVVLDALSIKPKYIWMQEGIINKEAAEVAEENGVEVVMDRCIYKEHIKWM